MKVNLKKKEEKGNRDENDEEYEIDLEHFTHVRLTMKNHDGRAYVCSIKTERDAFGNGEHDLWQAFLPAKNGDENVAPVVRKLDRTDRSSQSIHENL